MPIRDIQKLDLALPFWSYPIRATRESNPVFRKAIYTLEKKSYSKTLIAATLAVLFLLISFNVFRINWTLNDIVIKDGFSFVSKIISLLMFAMLVAQFIFWFFIQNSIQVKDFKK